MCRQGGVDGNGEGGGGQETASGTGMLRQEVWACPMSRPVFVFTFHLKLPMLPHISHMVATFTVVQVAPGRTQWDPKKAGHVWSMQKKYDNSLNKNI